MSSAELYDAATGTFSSVGAMAAARYEHTATLLSNGKVLVTGGRNTGNSVNTAELYDPTGATFAAAADTLGTARRAHSATRLADGNVLIVGGFNAANVGLTTAELYSPAE